MNIIGNCIWCVVGIVATIIIEMWMFEKKRISWRKYSFLIARGGEHMIPKLEMAYGDTKIEDLTITKIALWNSGNRLLKMDDFVSDHNITVCSISNYTKLLDVSIIDKSQEKNKFRVITSGDNCAVLEFEYMSKKDAIVLQVLHTGSANDIQLDYTIMGGKEPKRIIDGRTRKNNHTKIMKWLTVCLTICVVIVGGLLFAEEITNIFLTKNFQPLSDTMKIIMLLLFVSSEGYLILKMFKMAYYIDIPTSIRNSISFDDFVN